MDKRMRWWVIPGAMVVLLRVVTLEGSGAETEPSRDVVVDDAADGIVMLRDASDQPSGPVAVAEAAACVVFLPAELVGLRGVMTIWRRLDGQREPTPWLMLRSRVRSNATVPIAALARGRYDFEMVFGDAVDSYFAARDAAVPGIVTLQAAP